MLTIDNIPEPACRPHTMDQAAKGAVDSAKTLESMDSRLPDLDPHGPPPNRSVENQFAQRDKQRELVERWEKELGRLEGQAVEHIGFCEANAGVVEGGRSKLRREEPERRLSLVELELRRWLYEFRAALERLRKATAEVRRVLAGSRAKQFPGGKPREKFIPPPILSETPGQRSWVPSASGPGADGIIEMGPQSRGSRGPGLPPTFNPPRPWRTYDG